MNVLTLLEALQHLAVLFYVVIFPYSKVEESFNIQACHDIIYHGLNLPEYDHNLFPGVVPRTFIGPIIISALSYPFIFVKDLLIRDKFLSQVIIRITLGYLVLFTLKIFQNSVKQVFGKDVLKYLIILSLSQFHFYFYCSRTLPNIFALIFVLLSLSYWLQNNAGKFIFFSAFSIIIFRFDTLLLLSMCAIVSFFKRNISILKFIKFGVPSALICLLMTFVIDSCFWGRRIWPEGEVMWFNTVLNKSSNYGTSPFLWYFYSVIPRALLSSIILIPFGLYFDFKRSFTILFPAIIFVFLFSILPHKELRFIIYAFPLFNIVAACGLVHLTRRCEKHLNSFVAVLLCCGFVIANLIPTSIFASASYHNYYGGEAMKELHSLIPCDQQVNVHIANLAAQTGVTKFGENCENWNYNKTENLQIDGQELLQFTHLIIEDKETKYFLEKGTHKLLSNVNGFAQISIQWLEFNSLKLPSLTVKTETKLSILERDNH